uniref:EPOP n=1 Tax=Falco tinnunculus TaxID=100819 RepID=A0A8C4XJQ0_FALTI
MRGVRGAARGFARGLARGCACEMLGFVTSRPRCPIRGRRDGAVGCSPGYTVRGGAASAEPGEGGSRTEPRGSPASQTPPPPPPFFPSLGPSDQAERQSGALPGPAPSPAPAPGSAPQPPAQELAGGLGPVPPGGPGEPRREHFDRLIRQSKLWCYAKGFNLDGKSLRHGGRAEPCKAAELKPPGSKRTRRRNASKGNTPCKRLGSAGPPPPRNSFSLMGNFPCIPSLVVGEDGDLCPASSLGVKNSWVLSKTHPLWSWHLGGNAIPVPPSLKFRGYSLEDP